MFTFKQFTICDEHCAMKVGTDGVLLGAWADTKGAKHIIDAGSGSGLIALMLAQRTPEAHVTGVEIDAAAADDARHNAACAPFGERVNIECADLLSYARSHPQTADCVVSNPPYHEETLLPPSSARAAARHTAGGGLTFTALLEATTLLLKPDARRHCFSVVLPTAAASRFEATAAIYGLSLTRRTEVLTRPTKPCKRVLLEFSRGSHAEATKTERLVLVDGQGGRSEGYQALCRDFYL